MLVKPSTTTYTLIANLCTLIFSALLSSKLSASVRKLNITCIHCCRVYDYLKNRFIKVQTRQVEHLRITPQSHLPSTTHRDTLDELCLYLPEFFSRPPTPSWRIYDQHKTLRTIEVDIV